MTASWTHEYALSIHAPAGRIFEALTSERELEQVSATRSGQSPGSSATRVSRSSGRCTVCRAR
jgi:hypothetical protein